MITLYNGDCCQVMNSMESSCVDLVVTSPPYDNLRQYNGKIDGWSLDKCRDVIKCLHRVVKDGGVVVWVVGDATTNGSESGTSFKHALMFIEEGFKLHDTMIWRKTNPMPKVKTKRYFDCFEYMFVFSKGTPKTFNPIMVECKSGGKTYDSTCKNMGGESGRTHKTFTLNNERYKDNIWDIAIAQNKTEHPAVYPIQLVIDHVNSWSNEGDLVFDPFTGSGTTALACLKLNRNFVGSELDETYYEIAKNQISELEKELSVYKKELF